MRLHSIHRCFCYWWRFAYALTFSVSMFLHAVSSEAVLRIYSSPLSKLRFYPYFLGCTKLESCVKLTLNAIGGHSRYSIENRLTFRLISFCVIIIILVIFVVIYFVDSLLKTNNVLVGIWANYFRVSCTSCVWYIFYFVFRWSYEMEVVKDVI